MIIDLHIHSKSSDGAFTVEQIINEAKKRRIGFMSITDHDTIGCQEVATDLVTKAGIRFVAGVELNVTFSHPEYREGKPVSLDFLGYQFDAANQALREKLERMASYREERAAKILRNLNVEFKKEGTEELTKADFDAVTVAPPRQGIVHGRRNADLRIAGCPGPA